ncbi:sodium:calcium antiporter [Chloroflexota bacterium]
MVWIKFLACVVIILFSGTKTARYADIIADKTGMGRIWIGLLLLGVVTSLPELITGLSSVTMVGESGVPDLGLGTLLGSCTFNLLVLAVLDVMHREGPVLNLASTRQIASARMAILLFVITAASIGFSERLSGFTIGWVGISSIIIFGLYILGAWRAFKSEREYNESSVDIFTKSSEENPEVKGLWVKFIAASLMIVAAGVWLSFVGNEISETTSLDTSFVGSLLLAASTSMPELVVAISAFRLGAVDLAVADILGANMLDVTYIFLLDLLYTEGPLLSSVSNGHIIIALLAIAMSILVITGLLFRQKKKTFGIISWQGVFLIGFYLFGAYALFSSGMAL